ncbi:MAG: protoporphyrinogen oxidase [Thermobacillus sp. ZCTH02-B1]|uniref:protoporphyrinogen oxidase n=1 Tax=Thermobacillus sp. ZCTH02-B1 TaxID=1858795 RepID=UPI000B56B654|nr:protoporphyrinogen oxidase [Thermobacillus sp. ZCTH02-B1]OUM93660.1 MAG: protoporphyrinogen oxidase [Thermobacillus sp. ZCTH02-B1]
MAATGKPIVVVGGGMTGLAAAYYLRKFAGDAGIPARVTIVEASNRLGGKIETLRKDGFVIEKGPDSFLARKKAILELAADLGIEDELVPINPSGKKSYIVFRGKLHPMPDGLMLGIPTEIAPMLRTGLLSPLGKLRAGLDFVLPARKGGGDESIGAFLTRRLGREVVERIAEPLLAGIYAGDLDRLSLMATFPQFREAELRHGSLILGMRRAMRRRPAAGADGSPAARAGAEAEARSAASGNGAERSGAEPHAPSPADAILARFRGAPFLNFRRGLATIVEALERELAGADWRLGRRAVALRKGGAGDSGARYAVVLEDGEELAADAVIVTAPAWEAEKLLGDHVDCGMLRNVRYASVANVVLAFDKASFGREFHGSGFLVPRAEGRQITACTWTSSKWLHTSPPDKVLLRCYVGRAGDEDAVSLPDDQLVRLVRRDLEELIGVTAAPEMTEITRLHRSMPQYPVGHVEAMRDFRRRLAEALPGVWAAGAAFDGIGLPDCVRQARETAEAAIREWRDIAP